MTFVKNRWIIFVLCSVFLIIMGIILFFQFFSLYRVYGDSMSPTLVNDQVVVVNQSKDVEKGDLIVLRLEDVDYMKRVIGMPGDTVEIKNNQVYVNGKPLTEPYIIETDIADFPKMTIEQGKVFVLGDQRETSYDSRDFGAVSIENIVGQIIMY